MLNSMRTPVRLFGWLLMCAGVVALGIDAWAWIGGARRLTLAVELWTRLDAHSLEVLQGSIQRYLFPWLWDPIMTWVLKQPAAAVLGALGFLLAWLARR